MRSSLLSGALLGFALCGCDSDGAPREWTSADHDTPVAEPPAASARPAAAGSGRAPNLARPGVEEGAWRSFCARCHGPQGRGDGPEGPALGVSDLTRPAWQRATTDAAIASIITSGKGKMPPFQLPSAMTALLVRHVRSLGSARDAGADGPSAPAASARPAATAATR